MLTQIKAVVTGGTKGIGLSIAKALIEQDAQVVVCSRSQEDIDQAARLTDNRIHGIVSDVSSYEDCKRLINFANEELHGIDVLVNNAGVISPTDFLEEMNPIEWKKTFEINLFGTISCTQLVIPIMKRQGHGRIINLCGAGVGAKAMPRFSPYFTSKVAIAGFTEVIGDELKPFGIHVNCIAPGAINTQITDYIISQGVDKVGQVEYDNALARKKQGGTPIELTTKLINFLLSQESDHLSGCLLSAKWNPVEDLKKLKDISSNLYKLRRIDQDLFYEKN